MTENRIILDLIESGDLQKAVNLLDQTIDRLTEIDRITKQSNIGQQVVQRLQQELQAVKKNGEEYKKLNGELKAIENGQKAYADAVKRSNDQAAQSVAVTRKEVAELRKQLNQATDGNQIKKLELDLETASLAMRQARQEAKILAEQNQVLDNSYRGIVLANQRLGQQLRRLPINDTTGELERLKREFRANQEALKRFDAELGQNFRNVGNYEQAIRNAAQALKQSAGGFAQGFGGAGGGASGLLGGVAGIAGGIPQIAAVAGIVSGFGQILDFSKRINAELTKTAAITGLTGDALEDVTSKLSATASEFEQDYNEVLAAANAVVKTFNIDFTQAIDLINTGLLKGADLNGEFLDSLREYGPTFRDATLEAEKLVSVAIRGAQEGIFSDKAVDAVSEAAIRLREMPTATREAVRAIGLIPEEIDKQLSAGLIGIDDVIAQVSQAMAGLPRQSKLVGQAIADIFGEPGERVGLDFLLTLKDINKEIDVSDESLNKYQQQQKASLEAQERLNKAYADFGNIFGTIGNEIGIFTDVALAQLIEGINSIVSLFISASDQAKIFRDNIASLGREDTITGIEQTGQKIADLNKQLQNLQLELEATQTGFFAGLGGRGAAIIRDDISKTSEALKEYEQNLQQLAGRLAEIDNPTVKLTELQKDQINQYRRLVDATRDYKTALTPEEVEELTKAVDDQANAAKRAEEAFKKFKEELKDIKQISSQGIISREDFEINELTKNFGDVVRDAKGNIDLEDKGRDAKINFEALFGETVQEAVKNFRDEMEEFQKAIDEGRPIEVTSSFEAAKIRLEELGKLEEERTKKQEEESEKRKKLDEEEAANRLQIIQSAYDIANDIISTSFDLRQQKLNDELQALEEQEERKLQVIGDNEQARASIQAEFDQKRKEIQKQQAKAEKTAAIFSILLNMARGITAALTVPPPASFVFAGIVAALGAAQLTAASSRNIPAFWKGTKSSPEGFAWVGEKGFEAMRYGGRTYLTNDGPQLAYLPRGTEVIPHEQTVKFIQENPSILRNSMTVKDRSVQYYQQSAQPVQMPDNTDKLIKGIENIMKKQPWQVFQVDSTGMRSFQVRGGAKWQKIRNQNKWGS